jgi:ribokinase
MNKILVFGSFVVDLMSRASHLPVPGETVKGSFFKMGPGGKGFNQGVASHKAGADVTMVTKIGHDTFGQIALDTMKDLGMDTARILYSDIESTGTALILVDENTSQNQIMVVPGACGTITNKEVIFLRDKVKESQFLLIQLETNKDAIENVIDLAYQYGTKVILNPAPVQPISDEVLRKIDYITPNEVEAEILTGIRIDTIESANKAADWFFQKGVKNVVITLGVRGVYVATQQERKMIPAYTVKAVDSTGAGDAFNGGFVTALAEGKSIWDSCKFANALAALSVMKLGTTPSMPYRKDIDEFISSTKDEE